MTSNDTGTDTDNGKLKGWHVAMFVGGLFAVVFAMNITFITLALRSFTGEDVPDAYSRGVAYNEVLEDREAQRDLGWSLTVETQALAPQTVLVHLTLQDRDGTGINDADMTALLRRPTHEGLDQTFILNGIGNGSYEGQVTVPESGIWDLRIDASRNDEQHVEFEERLWVE